MKLRTRSGHPVLLASAVLALTLLSTPLISSAQAGPEVAPTGSYAAAVRASNPVGYWPLDDPVGSTTAADAVAGLDGVVEGGVTSGVPGAVDNRSAMQFSGTSCNGIVLDQHAATLQPQEVSIEAWVNLVDRAGRHTVWRSRWFGFELQFFDGVPAISGHAADQSTFAASLDAPITGGWHHLVGVKQDSETRLYVDGREVDLQPTSSGIHYEGDQITIGRAGHACGFGDFVGSIDEVALYGHPLSAEEVRDHYNAASQGPAGSYVVEFKAYIPQDRVVDPLSLGGGFGTIATDPCRSELSDTYRLPRSDPNYGAFVQSFYGGDGHRGFRGTFRVRQVMRFDFDGHHISNFRDSDGASNLGTTRRIFEQENIDGTRRQCEVRKRDDNGSEASSGKRISPGGIDVAIATVNAKDPLSKPRYLTPAVNGTFKIAFVSATRAQVTWRIDAFPSFAYRILRNGIPVMTSVIQDVRCTPTMGELGALNIATMLTQFQPAVSRDVDLTQTHQTDMRYCR